MRLPQTPILSLEIFSFLLCCNDNQMSTWKFQNFSSILQNLKNHYISHLSVLDVIFIPNNIFTNQFPIFKYVYVHLGWLSHIESWTWLLLMVEWLIIYCETSLNFLNGNISGCIVLLQSTQKKQCSIHSSIARHFMLSFEGVLV